MLPTLKKHSLKCYILQSDCPYPELFPFTESSITSSTSLSDSEDDNEDDDESEDLNFGGLKVLRISCLARSISSSDILACKHNNNYPY